MNLLINRGGYHGVETHTSYLPTRRILCARMGSNHQPPSFLARTTVGRCGVEPHTSYLSGKRSTDELAALAMAGNVRTVAHLTCLTSLTCRSTIEPLVRALAGGPVSVLLVSTHPTIFDESRRACQGEAGQ
jgi:hypothetical protein